MTVPGRDATHRRRVVAMAGHSGDEATARAGLEDPSPAVRATALGALARTGALSATDVGAALDDESTRVRARAAETAVGLGDVAGDLLVSHLADRSPEVVEAVCFALGELPAAGAVATGALAGVAGGHPDPLCREAAVAAIGAIGHPDGLEAILAAMTDKPAVRRRAVLALAAFDGPAVEAALETALSDRDWQVRQAAEDLTGRRRG